MRKALVTIGLSLAAHVVAAGAIFGPGLLRPRGVTTLAGESFEIPAPETTAELANASPTPETRTVEAPETNVQHEPTPHARAASKPSHEGRPSAGRSSGAPEGAAGGTGGPVLYGAVGDRTAADLATAFTRGFPQAASADPIWRTAPIGPAGEADVTITIDEGGRIESTQVGGSPTPAFATAIRKTLMLINGRTFVAHGKTTRLHLVGTVSNDAVRDGLHGDVFAIGGSYAGNEGNAFFALSIGRRIDIRVRAR